MQIGQVQIRDFAAAQDAGPGRRDDLKGIRQRGSSRRQLDSKPGWVVTKKSCRGPAMWRLMRFSNENLLIQLPIDTTSYLKKRILVDLPAGQDLVNDFRIPTQVALLGRQRCIRYRDAHEQSFDPHIGL
jgi:hypothetical protein